MVIEIKSRDREACRTYCIGNELLGGAYPWIRDMNYLGAGDVEWIACTCKKVKERVGLYRRSVSFPE